MQNYTNKARPKPYHLKNDRTAFAPKNAKMNQHENSSQEQDYVKFAPPLM